MRIAMIGQKGIPGVYGGIERHVEELSLEMARLGHEVLVYARKWYTPENLKNYNGVKIIHTPTLRTKNLDAITSTFFATIHAVFQNPDVIHYHGVGPSLLSWIPRLLSPRTKVVCTIHCLDRYHQKWGFFARFMLRLGERAGCAFANQTISVSKTIQSYCLNEYHRLTNFIPNGVPKAPAVRNPAILDQWDIRPGKYLLMVSRLVRHKGAHYLIEAWQFARQQNPELLGDQKLVIVGDGSFTDDCVKQLREMARGDGSIVFTGWQSGQNLSELYADCGLFVHPSENEGLPITVLQAMSYGRPVLVSDIPEHKEVVLDSKFWFANANIVSLAGKIIELMQNKNLLEETGKSNRELAGARYDWRDIAMKTAQIYLATAR